MQVYDELLPATKSESHGAVRWAPGSDPARPFHVGTMTITGTRCHARYCVDEISSGTAARQFVLFKIDAGSDAAEQFYSCLTTAGGLGLLCECRGYAATGNCKHLAALSTLLANEWL